MPKKRFKIDIVVSAKHHALREFRQKNGFTQKDLGRLLGVGQSLITAWENFRSYPKKPEIMETLCDWLKMSPEDLFPVFIRDSNFLKLQKKMTFVRAVDLRRLEAREIPALPSPEEIYEKIELAEKVKQALDTLTQREQEVVRKRFGFDGKQMTLREIGKEFGVGGRRILQIEDKALRKLRHPVRARKLKSFVE